MGTDIHLTIEAKRDNKWIFIASDISSYVDGYDNYNYHYSVIPFEIIDTLSERNYLFFSILSGVRGSLTPIQINRGYPSDMSEFSQWYHNNPGYNEGYVLLSELINYDWNLIPQSIYTFKYALKEEISKHYKAIQYLKNLNEEEIRLIFFFDS